MTVVAPYNLSYLNRGKYLTPEEVTASPIASVIDFSSVVDGGKVAQDEAIEELIAGASAEADQYCFGTRGMIGATVTTGETRRMYSNRRGEFVVWPDYWPVLEVREFQYGDNPAGYQTVTLSGATAILQPKQFTIIPDGLGSSVGPLQLGGSSRPLSLQFIQYEYVNGWPNGFLTADVAAAASAFDLDTPTGIYADTVLTVWDGSTTEQVQVAGSYSGTGPIPIAGTFRFSHGAGCNVSALPRTVKDAVLHFLVARVKEQGSGGMSLTEEATMEGGGSATTTSHLEDKMHAYDLLDDFRQVVISGR